jgi:Zn-finger nucleic acid-binding protein
MNRLTCPKCHAEMRQYERSGVVIDQCVECRGIFLDRGELERLAQAEQSWHQPHYDQGRRHFDDDDDHYRPHQDHRRDDYHHHKKHKRKSFLEDLFD